jgi:hypothetical protein
MCSSKSFSAARVHTRSQSRRTVAYTHEAPDDVYFRFYENELEGIADATVQQISRAISTGLIKSTHRRAPPASV